MSSSLIPEVMNWAKARRVGQALQHGLDRRLGGDRQDRVVHRAQGRAVLLHRVFEDTPGLRRRW
jgi:hypothetical protein